MAIKLCDIKGCPFEGGYFRNHYPGETPKEKNQILRVSKKRQEVNNKELRPILKELKNSGDGKCQIKSPVCIGSPVHSHHINGRIGKNLTDRNKMIRACNPCNGYVEEHSIWAKEKGFKDSIHDPNYKRIK